MPAHYFPGELFTVFHNQFENAVSTSGFISLVFDKSSEIQDKKNIHGQIGSRYGFPGNSNDSVKGIIA